MKFTFAPESKPFDGYTIKRAIRRGGFGEVYYALSDAGKEVALKLVQQNADIELRGVSQCLNIKHPNLVTIFDIREDSDGDQWIVMEYVSGKSMDQVLAGNPNGLPVEEVKQWVSGIAAGVSYLHERGVVHRDLKPGNIFREHGIVKTGDVGLSKLITPSRRSAHSQSVGTVYYMAPEVAQGRYGPEIDVYSLGVMLYEMLTGRVPFDGETAAEILMKHLTEKPDLAPIPERLRPVLARALDKDAMKRTSSVQQLEEEFNAAVAGKPIPMAIPEESFVRHGSDSPNGSQHSRPNRGANGRHPVRFRHVQQAHSHERGLLHSSNLWLIVACAVFFLMILRVSGPAGAHSIKAVMLVGMIGAIGYGFMRAGRASMAFVNAQLDRTRVYHAPPVRPAVAPAENRSKDVRSQKECGEPAHRKRHFFRRGATHPETRRLSHRERMTELSAGMLWAVLCTGIVTAGLCLFTSFLPDPGLVGLFAGTTLIGSWAILASAKLSEGRKLDGGFRRFMLLLLGGGVGAAAFWLDGTLLVDVPANGFTRAHAAFDSMGPQPLMDSIGQPTLAGYVIFFGAIFALRAWWRQTLALRPKRFQVSSLLLTLLVAYVVPLIWAFPQSWGVTCAAAISSVVQLSAPWLSDDQRTS